MRNMQFNPDLPPAFRSTGNRPENKNHDFLAQAMLMGRNPGGELDWVERHAARFRELYTREDALRDLMNSELTDATLQEIQRRLDSPENLH